MGIDIAAYVCHEWGAAAPYGKRSVQEVAQFSILRDRALFEVLGGLGLEHADALFPRRGLPADLPFNIVADAKDMDKPSWLTTAEVERALEAYPHAELARRYGLSSPRQAAIPAVLASMRAVDAWCAEHDDGGRAVLVFFFDG